ncbi:MAG TPA: hypothetical protein VLU99_09045 [Nitrososphaerales archaeon]|nr:hypothetical protein [Nitrososphaerales archaeon]HUK75924.1 hypothetical protein [Nitrososphaerales archaeon]
MRGNETSVAIAGAGLVVLLTVGVWVAVLPGIVQSGSASLPSPGTVGGATETTSTTVELTSSCGSASETYGNMTIPTDPCVSYGFSSATLKNATLASRQIQRYIKQAYEYHLVYFGSSRWNGRVTYAVLNVTGTQVVNGNWTAGYTVSYVGNYLVNATVLQTTSAKYQVTHVSSYALPDRNTTLAYSPDEFGAIQTAATNPIVESLMAHQPYYLQYVGPNGSGTSDDSRFVQFYQVNGTGTVGAYVSTSESVVIDSFFNLRISGECWPDGLVITDPWNAAGYSGCNN